ncbi:trypsin-like serine protease [Luteimonas cucumeris]|nr:trypsin-like serine protease [Luteimonas cucumeris]
MPGTKSAVHGPASGRLGTLRADVGAFWASAVLSRVMLGAFHAVVGPSSAAASARLAGGDGILAEGGASGRSALTRPLSASQPTSRVGVSPLKASHVTRSSLLIFLLAMSSTASAIVIRHDVDDSKYRIPASEFSALVDMPGEGHGVLIAPQWVITAAHTIPAHSELKQVVINGAARDVERVVVHSGYKTLPQELIDPAMASGEAMLIVVFLASSDDIALVKLTQPVADVTSCRDLQRQRRARPDRQDRGERRDGYGSHRARPQRPQSDGATPRVQ